MFFCEAEDGIRDLVRSRGLGDVYKRQSVDLVPTFFIGNGYYTGFGAGYKDRNTATSKLKINLDQDEKLDPQEDAFKSNATVFDFEDETDKNQKITPSLFDMGSNSFNQFKKKEDVMNTPLNIRNPGYNHQRPSLSDLKNLAEAENTPAYERRNVRLDSINHSSELNSSRIKMVMDEDNRPEIREENSFLHDNVD